MVDLLTRVRDAAPDETELHEVRDYLVGVFPLRFETTGGVASAMEPLAVYGLADDYWQTYRQHLEAVQDRRRPGSGARPRDARSVPDAGGG